MRKRLGYFLLYGVVFLGDPLSDLDSGTNKIDRANYEH